MKLRITLGFLGITMFMWGVASARTDSSLSIINLGPAGSESQFAASISNYQPDLISILTFADTNVANIGSAMFQDQSGWVRLTPYQSGQDVVAKFVSDNGFVTASGRTVNLRVNFKTPKTYVVGFSLQDKLGHTVSSAAAPVSIGGSKVLGESISVTSSFTRPIKYGSKGTDVTALQELLTTQGFYSGPITGFFGRLTQAAVKKYQAAQGISPRNGVVGPQTLAALNR